MNPGNYTVGNYTVGNYTVRRKGVDLAATYFIDQHGNPYWLIADHVNNQQVLVTDEEFQEQFYESNPKRKPHTLDKQVRYWKDKANLSKDERYKKLTARIQELEKLCASKRRHLRELDECRAWERGTEQMLEDALQRISTIPPGGNIARQALKELEKRRGPRPIEMKWELPFQVGDTFDRKDITPIERLTVARLEPGVVWCSRAGERSSTWATPGYWQSVGTNFRRPKKV